jgi:hypothetical protein
MKTSPSLSSYILSAIIGALLAVGVLEIPLGLVSANQFPVHSPQATFQPAFSKVTTTTNVNRSRKGDRLPVIRAGSVANTTIILKNAGAPHYAVQGAGAKPVQARTLEIEDSKRTPKPAPAPAVNCEALVTPISDPILGQRIGRCFV